MNDRRLGRVEREIARSDTIPTAIAADFLHGGAPGFARIFDRRGRRLTTIERLTDEPWAAFLDRVRDQVGNTAQAACSLLGGLPEGRHRRQLCRQISASRATSQCDRPTRGRAASLTGRGARSHPQSSACRPGVRPALGKVEPPGRARGRRRLVGKRVGIFAPTRTFVAVAARDRPRLARRQGRNDQSHVRRDPFAQWRPCRLLVDRSHTTRRPRTRYHWL